MRLPIKADRLRSILESNLLAEFNRGSLSCYCCGRKVNEATTGTIVKDVDGVRVICINNRCLEENERGIKYP